ncbi:MAG: DNA repair protein RecN [Lachnospiraceae bacterium]|nr:DNA repair protein RecN [Lachnospiraceae bacterium]
MLANLHVKNFAIIDEIDIDFGSHLNILTGETGAGKSIIIGSITIALGGRVSQEMIGKNGDYAMVEAVFHLDDEETLGKIRALDIEPEDGDLVISRRITESRSINKINGESVPVSTIKKVADYLIDIHGQHEHQSLLNPDRHLEIVDEFGGDKVQEMKREIEGLYHEYRRCKKEYEEDTFSTEERARQVDYLTFEQEEIQAAKLQKEEMETIDDKFQMASNAGNIVETLSYVHELCQDQAGASVGRALQRLQEISDLNSELTGFQDELIQIESLLGDFNRGISSYMGDFSFNENELNELSKRMDLIHSLQAKYGETYEEIMDHYKEVEEKLLQFEDYERFKAEKKEELDRLSLALDEACADLTELRKKTAWDLEESIAQALADLNFAHVDFAIEVREKDQAGEDGKDIAEFMIATNPGEPRRSLSKVASGGELSRIMLAIKSVFADHDQIETLIFDEIDAGISGRTAQKVSEKMAILAKRHQILCITHLPQIASMADDHYVIEKEVEADKSTTRIRPLSSEEAEEEIARILGGVEITDAVRESAHEMKEMAAQVKK